MTREEVREWLISHFGIEKDGTKQSEVINYLVHLLEQEACEDCISRKYLLSIANENGAYGYVSAHDVANAPSVNLKEQKSGHWIDDNENEIDAQYGRHAYRCSKCNKYANKFVGGTEDWWDLEKPNYCPHCGSKNGGMI